MLKIIAGSARGRSFDAPEGISTRPTLNKVREAVFGMIQFELNGAIVLDLFGGSGAFGLEAVSRGADIAYINDSSQKCVRLITANAKKLGFEHHVDVTCLDWAICLEKLRNAGIKPDFIYMDPPYASEFYQSAALTASQLIADGGALIVEHTSKTNIELEGFSQRQKHYGETFITIFRRAVD